MQWYGILYRQAEDTWIILKKMRSLGKANATGKNGEKFAIYIERLETVPYDDGWLRYDEPVSIFIKLNDMIASGKSSIKKALLSAISSEIISNLRESKITPVQE